MKRASGVWALLCLGACTSPAVGGGGGDATGSGGAGSSSGGGVGSSGLSSSSGGGTPDAGAPNEVLLVEGLLITRVAFAQTVSVDVVRNGSVVDPLQRRMPVLQDRAADVRVHVAAEADWAPQEVTAQVILRHADGRVVVNEDTRTPVPPSNDAQPPSLFTVPLPGGELDEGVEVTVRLLSAQGRAAALLSSHPAHFPAVGSSFPLRPQRQYPLRLHLVPIRYDRDGSGRLPDTSPAQLDLIRAQLATFYPVNEVTLTVGEPLPWSRPLTLSLNVNFGALNDALYDRRVEDGAADDVYYYGLVSAADTFDAYCGGSCVTGQSYLVEDAADADIRVGAGMGFGGPDSVATLIHELGHLHGREHAPCGVNSWDDAYPYTDASIGSWGRNPEDGSFLSPDVFTDFMGYCDDTWVSDYTMGALHTRARILADAQPRGVPASRFRMLSQEEDGTWHWGTVHNARPQGPTVALECLDARGQRIAQVLAHRVRLSHGPQWRLRVPDLPAGTRTLVGHAPQEFSVVVAPQP